LRPVTFRYNDAAEKGPHALQYGLIAEEVAKVCPDLVQYDKTAKPYTVYYHLLTPMLLNELQKTHRQAEAQRTQIALLKRHYAAGECEVASQGRQIALLRRENVDLKSELASLTLAQQQQTRILAKLTTSAQSLQPTRQASYVIRH